MLVIQLKESFVIIQKHEKGHWDEPFLGPFDYIKRCHIVLWILDMIVVVDDVLEVAGVGIGECKRGDKEVHPTHLS